MKVLVLHLIGGEDVCGSLCGLHETVLNTLKA